MIQKTMLLSMILLMMMVGECMAIPADPTPRKIQQPDGTFVTLSLHGNEYLHYTTTTDGFTVVKDERSARQRCFRLTLTRAVSRSRLWNA